MKKIRHFQSFWFLFGSSSTTVCSTLSIVNPNIGIPIASSSALITSIAVFITKNFLSKLKIRITILKDCFLKNLSYMEKHYINRWWIEKTIEKAAFKMKRIHSHYLDKPADIIKNIQLQLGKPFDNFVNIDSLLQNKWLNEVFFRLKWCNFFFNINLDSYNMERKVNLIWTPVLLLLIMIFGNQMTYTCCVGGRHQTEAINQNVYGEAIPKTEEVVEITRD